MRTLNAYLQIIQSKAQTDPLPERVLEGMLRQTNDTQNIMSVWQHKHKNNQLYTALLEILSEKTIPINETHTFSSAADYAFSSPKITSCINYLNKHYQFIAPQGDLAALLGAFFSFYNYFLSSLDDKLIACLDLQNFWEIKYQKSLQDCLNAIESRSQESLKYAWRNIVTIKDQIPLEQRENVIRNLLALLSCDTESLPFAIGCVISSSFYDWFPKEKHAFIADKLLVVLKNSFLLDADEFLPYCVIAEKLHWENQKLGSKEAESNAVHAILNYLKLDTCTSMRELKSMAPFAKLVVDISPQDQAEFAKHCLRYLHHANMEHTHIACYLLSHLPKWIAPEFQQEIVLMLLQRLTEENEITKLNILSVLPYIKDWMTKEQQRQVASSLPLSYDTEPLFNKGWEVLNCYADALNFSEQCFLMTSLCDFFSQGQIALMSLYSAYRQSPACQKLQHIIEGRLESDKRSSLSIRA